MKRVLIIASIVLNIVLLTGTSVIWFKIDSYIKGFIEARADRYTTQFDVLSSKPANVVFLGDSITAGGLWNELLPGVNVVNRGIGGNTTGDVLGRMEQIYMLKPEKLFIMIGVNDLKRQLGPNVAASNYIKIFDSIDKNLPGTEVFIQSVLPVNDSWKIDNTHIPALNIKLKEHAVQRGYTYIDLHTVFSDSDGQLAQNLSNDGIHLLGAGYNLWRKNIVTYVNDEHITH